MTVSAMFAAHGGTAPFLIEMVMDSSF